MDFTDMPDSRSGKRRAGSPGTSNVRNTTAMLERRNLTVVRIELGPNLTDVMRNGRQK